MFSRKLTTGFTIVELLIVIVVIAILAAISVVAYNGIQTRASNAQVASGVNQYIKAIQNYKTINSAYPAVNGCLGANYPNGVCWQGDSGNFSVSSTLDAGLAEFVPSKPTLATELFSIGITNNMRAGLLYQSLSSTTSRLVYYQKGINVPCLSGFSAGNEGGVVTQCLLTLTN